MFGSPFACMSDAAVLVVLVRELMTRAEVGVAIWLRAWKCESCAVHLEVCTVQNGSSHVGERTSSCADCN